jgi:uncharacterized OsmC-like protein
MTKHVFNLRMTCSYGPKENEIASLNVQVLDNNDWKNLDLNITTPGFLVYVYSIFTCQHLYLRTNGTERNLRFHSAQGRILVEASEDWSLEKVDVGFSVTLASGESSADSIAYIISRMKQCPVSINLPQDIEINTSVEFNNGQ